MPVPETCRAEALALPIVRWAFFHFPRVQPGEAARCLRAQVHPFHFHDHACLFRTTFFCFITTIIIFFDVIVLLLLRAEVYSAHIQHIPSMPIDDAYVPMLRAQESLALTVECLYSPLGFGSGPTMLESEKLQEQE